MPADAQPSNVFSLRQRPGYRPDLATLARGHIAAARAKLGQTPEQFAATLAERLTWAPTAAVVRSWETSVTPPGDVLLAAGLASDTTTDAGTVSVDGDPDVSHIYATRRHLARPEWQGMIRDCTRHIWLDGMAEQGYANDGDVPAILERAAAGGCDIRVLLLNPDYRNIADIDADEGNPAGTLSARIRGSLSRFGRMAKKCAGRMEIRTYDAFPTVSIVRGDDRMLVTHYLRFFTGGDSPTLLLEAECGGELFSRYERHFNQLWDDAEERTAA